MNECKSVGGYIRVSTQEQSQKGLSLESQQADIEEYCRKNGYRLTKLYIDRGITARKNLYKREAFMEMMHDAEAHKINHIVILRLDRFFRNVYDYHRMMNEYLIPNDCGWSAVKEDYDTTTTNGRLMINLRLSIAEQECDQDSDRIKDVFSNRIKDGYIVSGGIPFGYNKTEDKKLTINEEQKEIVVDIFNYFNYCNSIKRTMYAMNEKYGLSYVYQTYKRYLSNSIYIGKYGSNSTFCEPIIPIDLFNIVQEKLSHNVKKAYTGRIYLFAGMLICHRCHHTFGSVYSSGFRKNGRNRGETIYYRCWKAYNNRSCSNRSNISEKKIEEYLLNNVSSELNKYAISITAQEQANKKTVAKKNNATVEKKLERLKSLYVEGIITLDELKQKKSDLESSIIVIEEPKSIIDIEKVQSIIDGGFLSIYDDLTRLEKQSFWKSIIKHIEIEDGEISSIKFL